MHFKNSRVCCFLRLISRLGTQTETSSFCETLYRILEYSHSSYLNTQSKPNFQICNSDFIMMYCIEFADHGFFII